MGAAVVLDFAHKVEILKRRQELETIEQLQGALELLRKDMQFIGLIQEVSAATLLRPIGLASQHLTALAGSQSTLETIAAMLPSTADAADR